MHVVKFVELSVLVTNQPLQLCFGRRCSLNSISILKLESLRSPTLCMNCSTTEVSDRRVGTRSMKKCLHNSNRILTKTIIGNWGGSEKGMFTNLNRTDRRGRIKKSRRTDS